MADTRIISKVVKMLKQEGGTSAYDIQQVFSLSQYDVVDIILQIQQHYIVRKTGKILEIIAKK